MNFMESLFVVSTETIAAGFRPNGEYVTWGRNPFKKGVYLIRGNICCECNESDLMNYMELVPQKTREHNAQILEDLSTLPKWGTVFNQLAELLT